MNELSRQAIEQSGYRRDGFADHYNAFRPKPPPVLLAALIRYAGGPPLRCVVDLGSGTGLSTRAWAGRAGEVVGVEANESMRAVAERETEEENVRYVAAFASETGLPEGLADLVTCSQSFHWMEPAPTLAEAARLLRPRRRSTSAAGRRTSPARTRVSRARTRSRDGYRLTSYPGV
jgi:SAM-dependent methyltransferase